MAGETEFLRQVEDVLQANDASGAVAVCTPVPEANRLGRVLVRLREESRLVPAADAMHRFWQVVTRERGVSPAVKIEGAAPAPLVPVAPAAARCEVRHAESLELPAARPPQAFAPVGPARRQESDAPVGSTPHDRPTPLVDLFDWCEGTLDDAAAGAVERGLAASAEARAAVKSTAKLAAACGFLRQASRATPRPDAFARFQERLARELDAELDSASRGEVVCGSDDSLELVEVAAAEETAASLEIGRSLAGQSLAAPVGRMRGNASWIVAACVLMGLGLFLPALFRGDPSAGVFAELERVRTVDDLEPLHEAAVAMVGETLLDWEALRPQALAERQLLAHLTAATVSDRADPALPATVRFLARRQQAEANFWSRYAGGERLGTFETAAHAAGPMGTEPTGQAGTTLRQAVRAGRWADVELWCRGRSDAGSQALGVWAVAAQGKHDEAAALLARLEGTGAGLLSRVFAAGVWMVLDRPAEALPRYRALAADLRGSSLPIGCILEFDLGDRRQADDWYARFGEVCAERGWANAWREVDALRTPSAAEAPAVTRWRSSAGDGSPVRIVPIAEDQAGFEWLSQQGGADRGEIVLDRSVGSDFEVSFRFRFHPAETLGAAPRLLLHGRRNLGGDHALRAIIATDRLALGRVEPGPGWGSRFVGLDQQTADGPSLGRAVSFAGIAPDVWQRVRFVVRTTGDRAEASLKVWPEGSPEPDGRQVVASTLSAPLGTGFGLSVVDGRAAFEQFRLRTFRPATDLPVAESP